MLIMLFQGFSVWANVQSSSPHWHCYTSQGSVAHTVIHLIPSPTVLFFISWSKLCICNKCIFFYVCNDAFCINPCFHTQQGFRTMNWMSPTPVTSPFCPYTSSFPFVQIWFPKVCEYNRCLLGVFSLIVWTYAECRREHGGTMRELLLPPCNQTLIEEEWEMHG